MDIKPSTEALSNDPTAKPEPDAEAPTQPDVPEKFRQEDGSLNQEALLSSYLELEKTRGGSTEDQGTQEESVPAEPTTEGTGEPTEKPDDYFEQFSDSYDVESGKLSDEAIAKVKADIPGVSDAMINQFMAGQFALASQMQDRLMTVAGGKDGYSQMIEWASTQLNESETTTFNEAVNSGNEVAATEAVKGLNARFRQNSSVKPQRTLSGDGVGSGNNGYVSYNDFIEDISKPEYKRSEQFRQSVQKRLAASYF